jgi:hypothetical protein
MMTSMRIQARYREKEKKKKRWKEKQDMEGGVSCDDLPQTAGRATGGEQ